MISRLYIKDFILIKELELQLTDGFISVTGETGAGKSILVGAIGLLLGNRVDTKTIREGAPKAIIEADINLSGIPDIESLFVSNDLDFSPLCTIRREIVDSGKSRAFINDTPVTATVLKAIGLQLVDIHSQHHNMLIGEESYQISVLDTLADNAELLEEYRGAYRAFNEAKSTFQKEKQRIAESKKEEEFISFQLEQLEEARLVPGELIELEERQSIALHSTEVIEGLRQIIAFSNADSDGRSPLSEINGAIRLLSRVAEQNVKLGELCHRLEEVSLELNDITRDADVLIDTVDIDPEELASIESRLDLLQGLLFKFKLQDESELIALRDSYARQLKEINNSEEYLLQLSKDLSKKEKEAHRLALMITETRQKSVELLKPPLHQLMKELAIAGARFEVHIEPLTHLSESGIDAVQFLFSTNNKNVLQPIREVASGGEISRFMLALKTILSAHTVLPTIIFDEIDTGVSGEIAEKLGRVMQRLGRHIQVLSITHLPQIAALSQTQFVVSKQVDGESYTTTIEEVEGDARVHHLATMLTGATMTQAAIDNAKELLAKKDDDETSK